MMATSIYKMMGTTKEEYEALIDRIMEPPIFIKSFRNYEDSFPNKVEGESKDGKL